MKSQSRVESGASVCFFPELPFTPHFPFLVQFYYYYLSTLINQPPEVFGGMQQTCAVAALALVGTFHKIILHVSIVDLIPIYACIDMSSRKVDKELLSISGVKLKNL